MAPSQLKQLKASLREHGVLGPQKSKKQKKANAKDASKRIQRNVALESIRERFNPFETKAPARKDKFEVASAKPKKISIDRPGVSRSQGEERRRETLLREMQSRNKVGGMLDRRFGEGDNTMSLEEKAAERFARQSLRSSKKNSMFNLEDDSDEEMVLTHGGQSLEFGGVTKDDFAENMSGSEGAEFDAQDDRPRKRLRLEGDVAEEEDEDTEGMPERRKTKNEVMKEVIAKSKMYKAERQAAKADDDDLRAELDKGMGEFYEALRNRQPVAKQLPSPPTTDTEPVMDPGRAAMLAGKSREAAEKEYEANIRQLQMDARSKPSVRTKTDEEKAAEQAAKLEELERKRLRRQKGEAESSDEDEEEEGDEEAVKDFDDGIDDAEAFGLAQPQYPPRPQLDVEDEDEFVYDDIASDPEAESAGSDLDSDDESEAELNDDGDDDFINGLVLPKASGIPSQSDNRQPSKSLAYTFPCPQTHEELLEVTQNTKLTDLPTIVQRIRALYHKGLASENQAKLDTFAAVLLEHIAYLADSDVEDLPFPVLESLLRHLHSMAKTQPEAVGLAFRNHLREIADERSLSLLPGDLIVLTGISTVFPTSDHFHPVATPAMLTIARYLGQSSVQTLQDLGRGAYCCTLALQHQRLAKRYIPEVITYIVNALAILAPIPFANKSGDKTPFNVPIRLPDSSLRVTKQRAAALQPPNFNDLRTVANVEPSQSGLLDLFVKLSSQAAQLWQAKRAFPEIINPVQQIIAHLLEHGNDVLSKKLQRNIQQTSQTIASLIQANVQSRKPLLLHNHRPLAIKLSIPAFVENFNPDRHYDPDRERAEMAKLKAEHKKERKGAMRELRKDANFVAREQLRGKKAKDEAYDKKFKRLVAEIQGEEGREAKEYAREKARRKGKF